MLDTNCKSKNELISDVLRWTPTIRHSSVSRLRKIYTNLVCTDTGSRLENLPRAIADRDARKRKSRDFELSACPDDDMVDIRVKVDFFSPNYIFDRVVAHDRALSMDSIELNCVLMLKWIVWIRTVWLNWIAWNRNVFDS